MDAPNPDRSEPSEAADRALSESREAGRGEGQRAALRLGILDLCESYGVSLSDERRAELEAMDVARLDELRLALKKDRRWPGGAPAAGLARPKNFGLGGVDTRKTRKWSAIMTLIVLGGVTVLSFLPAGIASRSAKAFCAGVAIGTPLGEVQARAETARFAVTPLASGAWLFEHPWSLGRANCVVRIDVDKRVTSATPSD